MSSKADEMRPLYGENDITSGNNRIVDLQKSDEPWFISVQTQKQALRKQVRGKLKDLSREEILSQSQMVWDKMVELPWYQQAKAIGVFLSMPHGEIITDGLIRQCVQDGKVLYVPQVGGNFELAQMELLQVVVGQEDDDDDHDAGEESNGETESKNNMLFYERWPKNKWNIPEPPATMPIQMAHPGDIDLLVVPGLAFDKKGNRLGQGKGYYDRFIERMSVKPLNLVAVCLDCQLLKDSLIPVHDSDQRMHMILSPSDTVVVNEAQS